jgi:ribosomal protein L11 methyltransferase
VGTGSGILAIAAVLLDIPKVVGIDIDYQAVECAKKNAELNNIADKIAFSDSLLYKLDGVFSIIVANILPHTLIDLKSDLLSHLASSGYLILSGILQEKAGEVVDAFTRDITFVRETKEDEWSCLLFKK